MSRDGKKSTVNFKDEFAGIKRKFDAKRNYWLYLKVDIESKYPLLCRFVAFRAGEDEVPYLERLAEPIAVFSAKISAFDAALTKVENAVATASERDFRDASCSLEKFFYESLCPNVEYMQRVRDRVEEAFVAIVVPKKITIADIESILDGFLKTFQDCLDMM